MITKETSLDDMLSWVMKTGEYGVKLMSLLLCKEIQTPMAIQK